MKIRKNHQKKRGAALVEYGLLIAGVALVSAAAISVFGQKVGAITGAAASALPGNSPDNIGTFDPGQVVLTKKGENGTIQIDWDNVGTDQNSLDTLLGDGANVATGGDSTGGN